jgi:1-deoxy-D-xylulose-5-phosphate reductoisomerase
VVDGSEDHHRLVDADEQGTRGHRGARAVRHSFDQIEVVVHPQSVVHSMVEFSDGCTMAQLSLPDMRLPIGYALAYPGRIGTPFGRIDWTQLGRLDFEAADTTTFRCLGLAYQAGRMGSTAPAWLSAANEVAVEAFLEGRLRWPQIAEVCDRVLQRYQPGADATVDDIVAADATARAVAHKEIAA